MRLLQPLVFVAASLLFAPAFAQNMDPLSQSDIHKSPDATRIMENLTDRHCDEAVALFNQVAPAGDPEVIFVGGSMFARGVCVKQDLARGIKLILIASNKGSADASNDLGLRAGLGDGVPQDYAVAGQFFRKGSGATAGTGVNDYALGYGLTVLAIAQDLVGKENLPVHGSEVAGPFPISIDIAASRVSADHNASSMRMHEQSVLVAAANDAWTAAVKKVPAADPAQIGSPTPFNSHIVFNP